MRFVARDIETTGLYPTATMLNGVLRPPKIFCIATNDGKVLKVITNIEQDRAVLEGPKVCKIFHSAAFDCFWLKMLYGITVRNVWCTKLMEQVILGDNLPRDNNKIPEWLKEKLSSSLVYTLARYGLAELENKKGDNKMGALFATRPINKPLTVDEQEYAKDDVRYLPQLQAMQERRLTKLDLMRVAMLENKCVEVVVRMRAAGITLDVNKWLQIERNNLKEIHNITKKLPATVNNWNSPQQVKKYFNSIGVPMASFDDITDDFVAEYNNPVLNNFVKMRDLSTQVSKYGSNFLYGADVKGGPERSFIDEDGRIRVDYDQIMNTGRFSVSKPPMHGLPREGDQRSAIVARKGYVFVDGDFGGQELGIAAAASGEELWIKALLRGEDPLSLMASTMFTDWSEGTEKSCPFHRKCKCKQHKKQRQDVKEITYGTMYGAYPKSISIKIKRTKKETAKLFNKFKRAAPKLNRWLIKNAKETIRTRISYSADVYRRRRTVRDPQEWQVRNVGYNNPVQPCAANMIKLAMISLNEAFPIVFVWHDAIILEVKISQAKKAVKELRGIMEKAADYCTGIPGLIKAGPSIVTNLTKK